MSAFWAVSGWIVAVIWAAAWWLAHDNARLYEKLYRDADAGWLRALDRWSESVRLWEESDRRHARRAAKERAP